VCVMFIWCVFGGFDFAGPSLFPVLGFLTGNFAAGVQIGQITVSTDTVQQLCHSQLLYHKLVPWY
jgi:hypothetical protein